jgi:hypothetical protein
LTILDNYVTLREKLNKEIIHDNEYKSYASA